MLALLAIAAVVPALVAGQDSSSAAAVASAAAVSADVDHANHIGSADLRLDLHSPFLVALCSFLWPSAPPFLPCLSPCLGSGFTHPLPRHSARKVAASALSWRMKLTFRNDVLP